MNQKVSASEIAAVREMDAIRNSTAGLVQCDGCPDVVLVAPSRPGHRTDCGLCQAHCRCYVMPEGIS